MKNYSPNVLLVALAATLVLLPGACDHVPGMAPTTRQAAPATPQRPPPVVTVATAQKGDMPIFLEEIGRCEAWESVNVQPQVAGRLVGIHFEDGAEIAKGQLLFTIDARPYEAALAQARAALLQRQAERDLARQEATRVEALANTAAVSQQEVDARRGALAVTDAQVKAAEAAVETAQIRLDYCTIRSPIEGRAGRRLADVGTVVRENGEALVSLQRLDPIYVEFAVPERSLPAIRQRMAGGTLKVQVWLPEVPGQVRLGDLTFLDNAIASGSGTIKLRARLANADRYFWAGQFVQVRLLLGAIKDAVLVPAEAVQIGQSGPYLYVAKPGEGEGVLLAQMVGVKVGQKYEGRYAVEGAVQAGQQVVTSGQAMVVPGGRIAVRRPGPGRGVTGPGSASTQPAAGASSPTP
jgi:multidrug efflux system membrane fusion protein